MEETASTAAFRKQLAIWVLLVNLVILVLVGISIRQSRLQYEETAAITTQNLSQVLEEYINGVITKTDNALLTVADEAEKQLAGGGINRRVFNAYIARQKALIPEIDSLRMSNAQGFVLYGTSVVPSSPINVADRDYFISLSNNSKSGIFISKPIIGRISGKRVVVIARRFNHPNGSFAGIVYTAIILEKFAEAFSRVNVGKHGVVTLFDNEITILSRYPEPQRDGGIIGKKSKSADILGFFRRGQTSVTYEARSTIDGIQRIYSFRKIYAYPLYILVGLAREDYLAEWRNENTKMSAILVLFFLLTLLGAWLLYRYIHERKQAEEAISKLAALVESSDDAIIGKTLDGIVTSWNSGAERLYDYTKEEAIGRPISFLVPPDHSDEVFFLLEQVRYGKRVDQYETARMKKGGDIIDVSVTISPVKDSTGKITGASAIARNITERKRAEEKLKEIIEKLEAANKELDAFSYSVSHDLRAPLRHMTGFAELLQKRLLEHPDEKAHGYAATIVGAAKRMEVLIDDLLAFSRVGRSEMKMEKINFNIIIREVVFEIQTAAKDRNIIWKINELPDVYGDQSMLRLVLVNLVSNAVKYTRTRTEAEISIGCKDEGNAIVFFVKDNGVGFDMASADKLFGVFQRLHTQDEFEGTGIGLASVRRIISRHNGMTWAEGVKEQGATFYFSLPKIGS